MSHMSTRHTWCCNAHLRIVAHERHTYAMCTSWALPYFEHMMRHLSIAPHGHFPTLGTSCVMRPFAIVQSASTMQQSLTVPSKSGATLHEQLDTQATMLEIPAAQKELAQHALDKKHARFFELTVTEHMSYSKGDRPRKVPRWDPLPCTSVHTQSEPSADGEHTAVAGCETRDKIPPMGLVLGGRDGVLISPEKDPHSQLEINALFNALDEKLAREHIERVRFTPPGLRSALHSHALDQWTALQAVSPENTQSASASPRQNCVVHCIATS
ncbi:hypothetical protein BGW80DRAFT_1444987 [Lactifluus volemus]|nr:hypothetical protein BGW80DRAFT_1444987 [Lactifluus volemus]